MKLNPSLVVLVVALPLGCGWLNRVGPQEPEPMSYAEQQAAYDEFVKQRQAQEAEKAAAAEASRVEAEEQDARAATEAAEKLEADARSALAEGDYDTAWELARKCRRPKATRKHPGCMEVEDLATCELTMLRTEVPAEVRSHHLDKIDEGQSVALDECVARARKALGPEYERAVAARDFIDDTSGTYDAIFNYILATFVKDRSISYQAEFEAERIVEIIPRDVCPVWRQAIKDHGKEHLDPAISMYCTDDFPHEVQNNTSGATTTLTVRHCEKILRKMCRW